MTTHANKAKSYDIGRAEYPAELIDYLYREIGIKPTDTIADIGCGTGKLTKHFVKRGNRVYAVEYDADMLRVAAQNLSEHPNFTPLNASAEKTGLNDGLIDHIVCGTSYCWFDRIKSVPEFKRISKPEGNAIIAHLGGEDSEFIRELKTVQDKYRQPVPVKPDMSPPFRDGRFTEKTFTFTVRDTLHQFIHNMLSQSHAPNETNTHYKPYCRELTAVFNKHAKNGVVEPTLNVHCLIGKVHHLKVHHLKEGTHAAY